MGTWTDLIKPVRHTPRLWLEHLWIYEDLESRVPIREVSLLPGLNIIWAKTGVGETGARRAGHSVGKTTLCALIRRCLGDEHWAGQSGLDAQLKENLPKGGVVARLHVNDVCWTVLRPFGGYSARSKAVCGDDSEAIWNETTLDYKSFHEKLEAELLAGFPERKIPVTQEQLHLSQILAWCTRDQGCRFTSYFDWRHGGGEGFEKPAQSKKYLILSVLGTLRSEETKLLEAVNADERELRKQEKLRDEQLRQPEFLRDEALSRLRFRLKVIADIPFESDDLFSPSIARLIRDHVRDLGDVNTKLQQLIVGVQNEQTECKTQLLEIGRRLEIVSLTIQRDTGAWEGRQKELSDIQDRLNLLRQPIGRCVYGDTPYAECNYILAHASSRNMGDFAREKDARERLKDDSDQIDQYRQQEESLKREKLRLERSFNELQRQVNETSSKLNANDRHSEYLQDQRDQYILNDAILNRQNDYPPLQKTDELLVTICERKDAYSAKILTLRGDRSVREKAVRVLMNRLTLAIQDEGVSGEFNSDADHLFSVTPPAAAFDVLAILLGDLTCLADSASASSHHPGFMVHDCPREADMDAELYRSYMSLAAHLAEDLGNGQGTAPFQYIITTTTEPPNELQNDRHVRLELVPGSDAGLLLRRRLVRPGMLDLIGANGEEPRV